MRATLTRFLLWMWLMAATTVASAQQIQFAEPIDLSRTGSAAQFDAYGRRFALKLSDNARVLQKLSVARKQELQRYHLLRGSLDGQPGSWVRITESPAGTEGAIWDGHDLYAVTTYQRIAPLLANSLPVAADQTVIYRLADARDLLPENFCAAGDAKPATTGLAQYRSMVRQLKSDVGGLSQQIEIALIADSPFASKEAPDPTAAMLARLNIVEGIFSEQVGLLVLATDVRVLAPDADPFTTTNASTLLDQLGHYRGADAQLRARGLAHLMTGRNLDGTTAGIAYVDVACDANRGVSLSERSYGATISALIMAHELGHNLGAPHDGEAGGACASVSGGFIMNPTVSTYVTFSQCSIDQMHAALARASCVTPANYADAALDVDSTNVAADGGVPFTLGFSASSTGTNPASDVAFNLTLPDNAGVTLEGAVAEGGSCSIAGLAATCSLGALSPGDRRAVSVSARGTLAANFVAHARVSASNDPLGFDDTGDVAVAVRSGIDAAVSVSTDQSELAIGTPLTVYTDVRSLRALPVRDAILSVNLNQPVRAASMPGASCTVNPYSVTCTVTEILPGPGNRLTIDADATAAGPLLATASVTAPGDGDSTNNTDHAHAWVQAQRDVELTAGPATLDLAIGDVYEIPFLVRSRGSQATGDVSLTMSLPADALVVDGVDAAGASCAAMDAAHWSCALGAIAPGDARLVRVRVHGTQASSVDVSAMADAGDDGYLPNNSAATRLRIDNLVDVGIVTASGGVGLENDDLEGQVVLRSGGRQAATHATLELDLNVAGVLHWVGIKGGADCELTTPQHARCDLPSMARGDQLSVSYRAVFPDAGTYDVKFTLRVPGDTAAANDTLTRPVLVRPYYDAGVTGQMNLHDLVVGATRDATFTVSATRRALTNVRFSAPNYLPALRVTGIQAAAGQCHVDANAGGICDFASLEAGQGADVTVTWEAEAAVQEDVAVMVSTAGDVILDNDMVQGRADVMAAADVELRVDPVVGGTRGATLNFPPISIVNGNTRAVGTRLDVTLPPEVSLQSVSAADALCSGTTVLHCEFASLDPQSTATVSISVRADAPGDYVSALKLSAINDINPVNDARELKVQISDASAAATTPAKGGGGGFEWLSLLLLALTKWGISRTSRAIPRKAAPWTSTASWPPTRNSAETGCSPI